MVAPTKTPIGTAWVDADGILWHRLDPGVRVSGSLAEETSWVLAGRPAPAIVDYGEVEFVDQDAREVFAGLGSTAPVLASALLVRPSENPGSSVLAYRFGLLKSDRPIAIFETESEAVTWAKRFLPRA